MLRPATAGGSREVKPARPDVSHRLRLRATTAAVAIPTLVFLAYALLYQLTKPSMVANAVALDLVEVLAYTTLTWASLTVACSVIALACDLAAMRLLRGADQRLGTIAVTSGVFAIAVLVAADNLAYTSSGWGLRVDDSPLGKVTFAVFSISLGVLVGRRVVNVSPRTANIVIAGFVVCSVAALGLVLAPLNATPAVRPERVAKAPAYNVVILSSDGVEANHMSIYGYKRPTTPFLDSISSELRKFDNAFSNNGPTTGSITSLLTGRSPVKTGVVFPPDALSAVDAHQTLPYMLGKLGYFRSNWAVPYYADATTQNLVGSFDLDNGDDIAGSVIHKLPLGTGPARSFVIETLTGPAALLKDILGLKESSNPYDEVTTSANYARLDNAHLRAVMAEIREHERFFINIHLLGTHGPRFDLVDRHFSKGQRQREPWLRDFYDDSIRQFDRNVQQIYSELKRTKRLDNTILVVTSDHGRRWRANRRVPLLIRFPNKMFADELSENVQRMDIAPTILDVLGFRRPSWMTGLSLIRPLPDDRTLVGANTLRGGAFNRGGTGDDDLVMLAIRCRSWIRQFPNGDIERGGIESSSSKCTKKPRIPTIPKP